jgi:phage replication O-like protein O
MRITAPTYTQTPNDLFDHWLPLLNEGELKVLLVIMRKTFGWHRTHDVISVSQLSKYTGMLEETVIKAAKSLQNKGVITREVSGPIGKQQTTYSLIVNEDSNNSYPSDKPRGPLGSDPRVQTEAQKKEYSKEKSKEIDCSESSPPDAAKTFNIKKITIKQFDKPDLSLSHEDLITLIVQNRKDWTKQEIDHIWNVLEKFTNPVRDLIKFCSTTVENLRKSNISKKIINKDNKCQKQTSYTPPSKNQFVTFNGVTSEKGTSMPLFQNWREATR